MTRQEFDTAYNEGYKNGYEAGRNERSHGEWIKDEENVYHCSCCYRRVHKGSMEDMQIDYPFCHCGADMRGETE